MSWVFLTERFAYKLKKPVRYELLDFRTIETRQYFCEEEVRLNRRLAGDVYIGTVRLVLDAHGHLQLGGEGKAADWLVKMRRLPADRMLDHEIKSGMANQETMRRIAERLASFHHDCEAIFIEPAAHCERLRQEIDSDRLELSAPAYGLDQKNINRLCAAQRNFLQESSALIAERMAGGKIIEGHGDLRPEHVCLEDGVLIIDCLEFSRLLRILDKIDEAGFLAMECERLDKPDLACALLRSYIALSGDTAPPELIHFYQCRRASVRAKLAIRHLQEEKFRYSPEWRQRAQRYLKIAAAHADQLRHSG